VLDTQTLTLDHPDVQAAKARWDAARRKASFSRKSSFSFENFFERFKDEGVRLSALQKDTGLTRERLRQIYNQYFRPLFGNRSGKERLHNHVVRTRFAKIKEAEAELFSTNELIRRAVTDARARGFVVEAVPLQTTGEEVGVVSTTLLRINGHLCSVKRASRIFATRGMRKRYISTTVALSVLEQVDMLIIYTEPEGLPERTFILSTKDIRAAYRRPITQTFRTLYLPTEKPSQSRDNYSRLKYWKYKDAWRLLRHKKQQPAPH